MGYYDLPIDEHPQKEKVRTKANHYLTGRDGGREIDLRKFALENMQLHGRLKNISDGKLEFWGDLKQNLERADAVAESIKKTIDGFIEKNQISAPTEPAYNPVWEPEEEVLTLDYEQANIGAVVWCTGYHSDFSWIEMPVFDGKGYPGHDRGVTGVWGLYFLDFRGYIHGVQDGFQESIGMQITSPITSWRGRRCPIQMLGASSMNFTWLVA